MSINKDSGEILLTEEDIQEFVKGNVSKRIQEVWGITSYDELREILKNQNNKVLEK